MKFFIFSLQKSQPVFLAVILSFVFYCNSSAQSFPETQSEVLRQQSMSAYPLVKWDSLRCAWYGECNPGLNQKRTGISSCPLSKRMLGWHAIGTSSASYQWQLLSDLSYFSYQVDPATGNATNSAQIAAFPTDATVTTAKANGVKVSLCVTLFHTTTQFNTFFANTTAQDSLISKLITAIAAANATGINIDFEGSGLSTTYLTPFVNFMSSLSGKLRAAIPNSELSIDLQGTYANSSTMLTALLPYVDVFILMGYDYYWSGQFYPGPIAPTYQFPAAAGDPNGHGNVSNDLNNLIRHVGASKIILGMPYYGRRWRTTNGCVIPATGNAASISTQFYYQFRQNADGYYSNTMREAYTFNAWHCFMDNNSVQNEQFIDDTVSLQKKYDLIKQRGILGAAVWRLGYDAGYNDCWNLVNQNLSNCPITADVDTLYDMGGPNGNYHNNESYSFSIAPVGATAVSLSFISFDLEANYDSLLIYDGVSASSPVIGRFTGNTIPATVYALSGAMTIRFKADGGTTKPGFKAFYNTHRCETLRKTISSGNWNNPSIWQCGIVPSENDSVEILAGNIITITGSAKAKTLTIHAGAELHMTDPAASFTVGRPALNTSTLKLDGTLVISNGTLMIMGNLICSGNYNFNLSGGRIIIDGNSGDVLTSVADGQPLLYCPTTTGIFNFSGGSLQFIDPPFGSSSETIISSYNFGPASILELGDGVSGTISNNVNGFGGNGFPAEIGSLKLKAATVLNNRVLRIIKPLLIKGSVEVSSGNLIQVAELTVGN